MVKIILPSLCFHPSSFFTYLVRKEAETSSLRSLHIQSSGSHSAWQATRFKGERRGPFQSCYTAVVVGRYSPCNWPVVWCAVGTQGFPPTRQACLCVNCRLPYCTVRFLKVSCATNGCQRPGCDYSSSHQLASSPK